MKTTGIIIATDDEQEYHPPYPLSLHQITPGRSLIDFQFEFHQSMGIKQIAVIVHPGMEKNLAHYVSERWPGFDVKFVRMQVTDQRTIRGAILRGCMWSQRFTRPEYILWILPHCEFTTDRVLDSPVNWTGPKPLEIRHNGRLIGGRIEEENIDIMTNRRVVIDDRIMYPICLEPEYQPEIIRLPGFNDYSKLEEITIA